VRITTKVPRSHTIRHTQSVGLLWMSGQFAVEAATYTTLYKYMVRSIKPSARFELAIPSKKPSLSNKGSRNFVL